MKKILMTLLFAICILFSCTISKNSAKNMKEAHKMLMQDERYYPKLCRPSIIDRDSMFYFCSSHNSVYKKNKIRKICTCEFAFPKKIDLLLGVNIRGGVNPSFQDILLYDSSFVFDYILPLIEKEEDRTIIEYTLSNANDSTFKNVIDFEHKIIINENAYYYLINSKKILCVVIYDIKWFKSVVPKEKWIYNQDCYDETVTMYLLVPLLDSVLAEDSVPNVAK